MIYKKIYWDENDKDVFLECYIADKVDWFTRKAILVIPGGGYSHVCHEREGEPVALAFMQYGINAFVSSRKIAGKPFYELKVPELQQLVRKLEAIERKGGLKSLDQKTEEEANSEALQALSWSFRPTVVS